MKYLPQFVFPVSLGNSTNMCAFLILSACWDINRRPAGHDPSFVLTEKRLQQKFHLRLESRLQRLWSTRRKFGRTITSGSPSGGKEEKIISRQYILTFPEAQNPSKGSFWGQRMWTQKEMVSKAFKLCAQAFRIIVIFILMQLVYLSRDLTFGDFLLTQPWVKIWWHALRLASAFQSSYRAGIPKEFSPGTLNNLGRRLLARLGTTHWPPKADLLTLINDQFLMLTEHCSVVIDEEGHQKTIRWSIGIISFPWSPINIQSCNNL